MMPDELLLNLKEALSLTKGYIQEEPESRALKSIQEQLEYLEAIYNQNRSFRTAEKNKLNMGIIAAKSDYDNCYPRLATLLYAITDAINHQKL